jgi:hypothetical protein
MTIAQFRRLALGLPEAVESAHMDHPDFRVGGKIFATLGYPEKGYCMVKLTPDQQVLFARAEPAMFVPAKGAWGKSGATCAELKSAKPKPLEAALIAAWRNTAPKALVRAFDADDPRA